MATFHHCTSLKTTPQDAAQAGQNETPAQSVAGEQATRSAQIKAVTDVAGSKRIDHADIKSAEGRARAQKDSLDPALGDYDVVKESDIDAVMRKLDAQDIPYVLERADGGNLGGLNKHHGGVNTRANEDMKAVWGEIYAREVREHNGVIGRSQGDEFMVVWPDLTHAEVTKIRADIEQKMRAKAKELGLDAIGHGKVHGVEESLPTGALYTQYGLVQGRKGDYTKLHTEALELANDAKDVYLKEVAAKNGWEYDKKKDAYYEPGTEQHRAHESAVRAAAGRGTESAHGVSGEARVDGRDTTVGEGLLDIAGRAQSPGAEGAGAEGAGSTTGRVGNSAPVLHSDGTSTPAHYELREASELIPSHDPNRGFVKNESYPEGVQERQYHSRQNEQLKVKQNAAKYDPRHTTNNAPEAVSGPPIILANGVVLGGNSRAMTLQLLHGSKEHAAQSEAYRNTLKDRVDAYGLNPKEVDSMRKPVLVRVLDTDVSSPKEMASLAMEFNRTSMEGIDAAATGVSRSRQISQRTLGILTEGLQERGTLANLLSSNHGDALVSSLLNDKALSEKELAGLTIKGTNRLNANGKNMVEAVMLGRILPDADLLNRISNTDLAKKLTASLSPLSKLSVKEDAWNISKHVEDAVATVQGFHETKGKGELLETRLGQTVLPGTRKELSPESRMLALALENMGQREFAAAVAQYAKDAAKARESSQQVEMMPCQRRPENA